MVGTDIFNSPITVKLIKIQYPGVGFFAAFFLCLATQSQSAVSELSYDLSGSLQHRVFLDGEPFYAETNNFTVQVRGSVVKIRTWGFVNAENVEPVRDHTFVTDENTAYHITTFDVNPDVVVNSQTATGNQLRMFNTLVDIFTNACPPNMAGNMGPIWIATASSVFIQSLDRREGEIYPEHFICPDWPDVGGSRLKASWSLSGQSPYLPECLVEYSDENVFNVVNKFFKR